VNRCNLSGLRVLNTRPRAQADELSRQIIAAQGQVIAFPTLDIQASDEAWINQLPDLNQVDQAVFVSSNAVTYAADRLASHWPERILVSAIGPGTARSLRQHAFRVDAMPVEADSEHLLLLPSLQQIKQQQILLFKGEGGRPLIADTLRQRGANLTELSVYRRSQPLITPDLANTWWQDKAVDIILVTSQEALHNLFAMVGHQNISHVQRIPCLVVSPRLAEAAQGSGMKTVVVSRIDQILETLHQFNKGLDHGQ